MGPCAISPAVVGVGVGMSVGVGGSGTGPAAGTEVGAEVGLGVGTLAHAELPIEVIVMVYCPAWR